MRACEREGGGEGKRERERGGSQGPGGSMGGPKTIVKVSWWYAFRRGDRRDLGDGMNTGVMDREIEEAFWGSVGVSFIEGHHPSYEDVSWLEKSNELR